MTATTPDNPIVSIGLPVFNGERHLQQAVESMLGQTFADLELIISDNASTDGTRDLCEQYAKQDARVRYLRQVQNIGAPHNWNFVVHQAKGQFFKWASANDYCNDRFVAACLQTLQSSPRCVLSFGRTRLVDENRGTISDYEGDLELLDDRPRDRFSRVGRDWQLNNAQSGLIRLDVLRRTRLDRPYVEGDLMLMAELALLGQYQRSPEAVLYRRVDDRSMSMRLDPTQLQQFFDPAGRRGRMWAAWPRHLDRFATVLRSPIGLREKLACLGIAARDASWDRVRLWSELTLMLRSGLGGAEPGTTKD